MAAEQPGPHRPARRAILPLTVGRLVGVLVADERERSGIGRKRIDPQERIKELVHLHRSFKRKSRREIARIYIRDHPELVQDSQAESVVRRLADRLREAEGVPKREALRREQLTELRGLLEAALDTVDSLLHDRG